MTREDGAAFFKAMRSCLTQRYDAKPTIDEPGKVKLEAQGRNIRLVTNLSGQGVLLIDAATPAFAEAALQHAISK